MAAVSGVPDQLAADSVKSGKKWQEANIKAYTELVNGESTRGLRKTKREIETNMRMFNNELNLEDMRDIFDPLRVAEGEEDQVPDSVKSYNVIRGPIVTIAAEERKRKLEYSAVATNADVVNAKDTEFKNRLFAYLSTLEKQIQEGEYVDESVVQAQLEQLQLDKSHNLKSAHEAMANECLQYFQNDPNIRLAHVFGKGFHWMLLAGEVCYRVYTVGKEIRVATVDLRDLYTIGIGSSDFHEDAEAWVEREYATLASLVAEFKLSKSEVKNLEKLQANAGTADTYQQVGGSISDGKFEGSAAFGEDLALSDPSDDPGEYESFQFEGNGEFGDEAENQYVDSDGRIRLDRVHWVSKRKLFSRENPETGVMDYVDADYEVPENSGEILEEIIVNEIWQGFRIADDIIKDVKPCDVQLRSIDNPALVRPPYVGAILNYATNESAVSLLDDIKAYKTDYDMWANKLRKLWITYQGAVMRVDRSRIPDDMALTEWLTWIKRDGISFEDSFRQSPDGTYLAGNMQSQNPIIQPQIYNEIIAATGQLDRLESKIKEIAAMPPARSGDLQGNEGLGVSQQAMVTATHRTEDSFILHNYVKTRVLAVMLETIKYLWDDDQAVKKQYLLSDLSQHMLQFDAKLMQEAEVGVVVSDSTKMAEFDREIGPIAFAHAQNGLLNLSDFVEFRNAPTPSLAKKKLQDAEEKKRAQDAEQAKLQGEEQRKTIEMQSQIQQQAHAQELEIIRVKAEEDRRTKLEVAQFQFGTGVIGQQMADENGDGVVDGVELEAAEIAANSAEEIKRMDVEAKERMHQEDIRIKEEEIKVKKMQVNKSNSK